MNEFITEVCVVSGAEMASIVFQQNATQSKTFNLNAKTYHLIMSAVRYLRYFTNDFL